eukprot:TRINITY_DN988_c0_g1_i1.p1 TRINITY_DN988_c0_g1~~TRINITY_DN988_c0_g1_i1.p1  ORF type:complete len:425 (+),score=145.23 TRINITY_DN988_c0_g1_i1:124-1398(+)
MYKTVDDLPTPCLVVNLNRLKNNTQKMLNFVNKHHNITLRPHIKTHKTIKGALYQLFGEENFEGLNTQQSKIVVSTLGEARFFKEGGFKDILYAVPISKNKLAFCDEIRQSINFHIMVDNVEAIHAITEYNKNQEEKRIWSIFIQVDCGGHRCGVNPEDESTKEFIIEINKAVENNDIFVKGLYDHAGQSYGTDSEESLVEVAKLECSIINDFAEKLKNGTYVDEVGPFQLDTVSIGSTPTICRFLPSFGEHINEFHPGNACLFDRSQLHFNSCTSKDIACTALVTIISRYPKRNEILVDGGALGLSKDLGPTARNKFKNQDEENNNNNDDDDDDMERRYKSNLESKWGIVEGHPDLVLSYLTQELCVIKLPENEDIDRFPVGMKLKIYPNHSCLTAACYPHYYILDDEDNVVDIWKTSPRVWN